jgi:hypothetical protein
VPHTPSRRYQGATKQTRHVAFNTRHQGAIKALACYTRHQGALKALACHTRHQGATKALLRRY